MKVAILAMLLPLLPSPVLAEGTNTPNTASATSNAAPSGVTSNVAPSTITIDGTTYEEVRWGRLTPSTVTMFHRTGIVTIPLWKLPPELQKQFGYDPARAAAYQAASAEKIRLQKAAAARAAITVNFGGTVDKVTGGGVVVRTRDARTYIQYSQSVYRGDEGMSPSVPLGTVEAEAEYAFLVGFPRPLAHNGPVRCRAYPDGSAIIDGEQYPKWVYQSDK